MTRAKTYIDGSDKTVFAAFYVSSINEWKIAQPRVLVLSEKAYYRVQYTHKTGAIDHYHKTELTKSRLCYPLHVSLTPLCVCESHFISY